MTSDNSFNEFHKNIISLKFLSEIIRNIFTIIVIGIVLYIFREIYLVTSEYLLLFLLISSGVLAYFFLPILFRELRAFLKSLTTAGCFVYAYFLSIGRVVLMSEKLSIDKSISNAGLQSISTKIASNRDDFEKSIFFLDHASNKMKLLGVTTDFYFKFGPGSPSYDKIIHFLESKKQIQILMLNPDPSNEEKTKGIEIPFNVVARAVAENEDPKTLQEKIRREFNSKLKLKAKYGDFLKIRLYNSTPLCSMTILDKRIQITPYLFGQKGDESPTFEFKKVEKNSLFEVYERHFDRLWDQGIEINDKYDGQ